MERSKEELESILHNGAYCILREFEVHEEEIYPEFIKYQLEEMNKALKEYMEKYTKKE